MNNKNKNKYNKNKNKNKYKGILSWYITGVHNGYSEYSIPTTCAEW